MRALPSQLLLSIIISDTSQEKTKKKAKKMTPDEVLQIGQEALWVSLKLALPMMGTALIVGLVISFFQALTQIQEMTLSFIPKILSIFTIMFILMPFFGSTLGVFTQMIFDKVVAAG